ncbi:MAG: hypothetical protein MUC47_03720 [Candidatus Kapabacteria bacterium]|nr:hypothetical protein [Candidatus Kapabacteria bacterium]
MIHHPYLLMMSLFMSFYGNATNRICEHPSQNYSTSMRFFLVRISMVALSKTLYGQRPRW